MRCWRQIHYIVASLSDEGGPVSNDRACDSTPEKMTGAVNEGKILDLLLRTASSEERAYRIVLWLVWPPRTKNCTINDKNNECHAKYRTIRIHIRTPC
jgi:hypothetical protein